MDFNAGASSQSYSAHIPNPTLDEIADFNSLRQNVTGKLNLDHWMVLPSQRTLHIFSLNKKLNGNLSIRNTICIDVDLIVKVFGENDDDMLFSLRLYSWPQLQTLIEQCGAQVKREVDLEFVDVVDSTAKSETNVCGTLNQHGDILGFKFGVVTKTEDCDFHEPLTEIAENSVVEYNAFVLQNSFLPEATSIRFKEDYPDDKQLVYKTSETNLSQSNNCSVCNEVFVAGEKDRHIRRHFNGESYQCYVCGRDFQSFIGLQRHARSNHITASAEFYCDLCKNSSIFETKESIENHIKRRHCKPSIGEMKCPICGKEFFILRKFNAHVNGHNRPRGKKCPICNKTFGSLTRHMNGTHLKIRNYVCDICGSAFTQWTSLKEHIETRHMQIHKRKQKREKELPSMFSCEICGKTFAYKRLLNVHATLHSGKVYNCDICGQSFRHPKYRSKHQRQHKDIVKLKCTMCDKEYVQKVGLRLHMQKIHGVEFDPAEKKYCNRSQ